MPKKVQNNRKSVSFSAAKTCVEWRTLLLETATEIQCAHCEESCHGQCENLVERDWS